MEIQTLPSEETKDYHSTVDTSRPFSSVKEAIAIFGERFLAAETYSPSPKPYGNIPKQPTSWKLSISPISPRRTTREIEDANNMTFESSLRKLEEELGETRKELKLLREREAETEVALATLNAELHKSMSKLAEAEAEKAAKAVAKREEERVKKDMIVRVESSPTLAQVLKEKTGENRGGRNRGMRNSPQKKKPIIPLVSDLFSWKKESPKSFHNPLFSSPHVYFGKS
ncbi:hypothetical protein RJ641_013007 [Dillenia turbinata]|uniref:Uncharacterized protein n=1 Tax=Dillenia turbinata TaxID=194707 RepID=A0AAN8WF54_9MAGN